MSLGDQQLRWNAEDEEYMDYTLKLFRKPGIPFTEVLLDNDALRVHPMLQRHHLERITRHRDCPSSEQEFEQLFQALPDEADKQFPPDESQFHEPSFWGLQEEGAL